MDTRSKTAVRNSHALVEWENGRVSIIQAGGGSLKEGSTQYITCGKKKHKAHIIACGK